MTWAAFILGSNRILNTPGVVVWDGQDGSNPLPLVAMERGKDGQLLAWVDVFGEDGNHIARLRRNAWVFNQEDRYEVTTAPESLTLIDRATGTIIVDAKVTGTDSLQLDQGVLFTPDGATEVAIEPGLLRVGGLVLSNNTFVGGSAITVSPTGLGIGGAPIPGLEDWLDG